MKGQQTAKDVDTAPLAPAAANASEEQPIDYDALEGLMDELGGADPDPEVCADLFERVGPRGQELVMADATMGPKARNLGLGGASEDEGGWLWGMVEAGAAQVGVDADATWDRAEDAASGALGSDWNPLNHPGIQQMQDTATNAWEAFKSGVGVGGQQSPADPQRQQQQVEQADPGQEAAPEPGPGVSPGEQMVTRPGGILYDANGKGSRITDVVVVEVIEVVTADATVITTGVEEAGKKDSYHVRGVDPDGPALDAYAGFGALARADELSEEMRGDTQIPVAEVKGRDDAKLAQIWNDKGGYIDAARGGIERAVAVAVMAAESGGAATDGGGMPIIRFENHKLNRNTEGLTVDWGKSNKATFDDHFRYADTQMGHEVNFQGASSGGKWEAFHGSQTTEWRVFELASQLASREIAARCMSIGAGQVMGFNAQKLGYDSAEAMLDDMTADVKANVGGVFKFIEANATAKAALEQNDFTGFAAQYNGEKYKDGYGKIIGSYTERFRALEAKYLSASGAETA